LGLHVKTEFLDFFESKAVGRGKAYRTAQRHRRAKVADPWIFIQVNDPLQSDLSERPLFLSPNKAVMNHKELPKGPRSGRHEKRGEKQRVALPDMRRLLCVTSVGLPTALPWLFL